MTSRIAIVVSSTERGPSSHDDMDEYGNTIIDTSPDHTAYTLEGVNCTAEEFLEWFDITDVNSEFAIVGGASNKLLDLGGASTTLHVGMRLEVSFEQFFDALIENRIRRANYQLDRLLKASKEKLGILQYL